MIASPRWMRRWALAGVGVAFAVSTVWTCAKKPTVPNLTETSISGRVLSAETGTPVGGAQVNSEPASEQVVTNSSGEYVLRANVNAG